MVNQKRQAENVTGVSNVAYDLMAVLTNNLDGVAAMEQYKEDAQGDPEALECFHKLQAQDQENIDLLRQFVANRLGQ